MSVLHEIATKLAALGLGTYEDGGNIVAGEDMPASPDECCAVRGYGGLADEHGIGVAGPIYETPAIQVCFRGNPGDHDGPMAKAQTARLELQKVQAEVLAASGVSSAFYHWIQAANPPFPVQPQDESGRHYIGVNLLCEKDLSA